MSSSFNPGSPQYPPGGAPQPAWSPPPSNSPSGGGMLAVVIVLALVGLLLLGCAGVGVVGWLLLGVSSRPMEMQQPPQPVAEAPAAVEPEAATGDNRTRWHFPTSPEGASGTIQKQGDQWIETRTDGMTQTFEERERTPDYVELFDHSRQLYVRLYADRIEWRREGQEWTRGQAGSWQAP